jgi:hypothetical protein
MAKLTFFSMAYILSKRLDSVGCKDFRHRRGSGTSHFPGNPCIGEAPGQACRRHVCKEYRQHAHIHDLEQLGWQAQGQVRWLLDKCDWGAAVAGALRVAKSLSISSRIALS